MRWHHSGGTAAASRLDITISKGVPLASNRQDCTDYLLSACTAHPLFLTLAEPYGLVRKNLIKRNRGLTELQLNLKGFQFLNINI